MILTREPRNFMDVVNWNTLEAPGVIGCVDGSFIAAWRIAGIDTETMDETGIEAWLDLLADGISALGDGEALRVVRTRKPWTPRTSQWQPPPPGSALEAMFLEQEAICAAPGFLWEDTITLWYHRHGEPDDAADRTVSAFGAACRRLEDRLGGALAMTRLGPRAIHGSAQDGIQDGPAWYSCSLTGNLPTILGLPERRVRIDPDALPVPLDHLIGFDIHQSDRNGPGRIDGRPVALMCLEGFRERGVNTGLLAQIQSLPQRLTWVAGYGAHSGAVMRKRTIMLQRLWRQSSADMAANVIGETQGRRGRFEDRMADRLEDTLDHVASGATGYGEAATYFLITGEPGHADRTLDAPVRSLYAAVDAAGLSLRRETVNFVPAALCVLPGHEGYNARAFDIRANAFTGLLPLRSIWQGEPVCPSPLMPPGTPALLRAQAQTGEAVDFNLHSSDLGHTLIFGPTGAGKSVLLGLIAAAFMRYESAQVICFDRQRSIAWACAALGGAFMEPKAGGRAGIAPLRHIHELGEAWAVEWLTTLVRTQKVEPDTQMLADLRKAAHDCTGQPDPDMGTLRSFCQFDPLRTALDPFISGAYASLFDEDTLFEAETPAVSGDMSDTLFEAAERTQQARQARFSAFETHALMEGNDNTVRLLVLDYIFATIQQRFDGRPTLVVFDEAWSFFREPLFIDRIRSWLKEGRKNNVCIVMATQSLADAIRSELTAELLESCPTRIFLPNVGAESPVLRQQYASLGITDPEIARIARMRPKRDYLVSQPEGRRVLAFALGDVNLSIIGRTSAADSRRVLDSDDPGTLWKEGFEHARHKHDRHTDRPQGHDKARGKGANNGKGGADETAPETAGDTEPEGKSDDTSEGATKTAGQTASETATETSTGVRRTVDAAG